MDPTVSARGARSALPLMSLTLFLDFVGLTLVIPLLPYWAERFGAGPRAIGVLAAGYAFAQLAATPLLGSLSDRVGRRPVILASLAVSAVGCAMTATAGSLPMLLAARLVGGLGGANVGAAQALVADTIPAAQRARAMGVIGAAIGLGHVAGPAAGGLLAAAAPTAPFWTAFALTVTNGALVWAFLPETRRRPSPMNAIGARSNLFADWAAALGPPAVRRLVTVGFAVSAAAMAMETIFALFALRRLGWGTAETGLSFAYTGAIVTVTQLGLVGLLAHRFGERRLLLGGLAMSAAGFALLPVGGPVAVLSALGLIGFGTGVVSPLLPTLLSLAAPEAAQGATLGLAQGIGGIGRLLGPLAAGGLFALDSAIPFLAAAVLCLCGFVVAHPLSQTPPAVAAQRGPPKAPPPVTSPVRTGNAMASHADQGAPCRVERHKDPDQSAPSTGGES